MRDVVEFSTWFTRGWTFQELIFSQRLLYFTPERTYFSCAVGNCSEDCPFDENVAREVYEEFRDDDPKAGFDFLHHPEEQGELDDDDLYVIFIVIYSPFSRIHRLYSEILVYDGVFGVETS